jgi:extracellular factor (EF) 3-hydroxypalmitic acid methyl ester biosynthesis protein
LARERTSLQGEAEVPSELLQFDNAAAARNRQLPSAVPGDAAIGDLKAVVDEIVDLGSFSDIPASEGLHLAISVTHRLIVAIVRLEANGHSRQELLEVLQSARAVHAESPFVRRLQEWPRGYAGDFETVEYLLKQRNRAVAGCFGYFLEQYALGSPIAQQHRNKVDIQAQALLSAVLRPTGFAVPRILMLAAGGSPDLRQVERTLDEHRFEATLLDQDEDALAFSASHLPRIEDRLALICANVVRGLPRAARRGPFDLVVAGGLFDYLPDRIAVSVLRQSRNRLLRAGGQLLFTNISCGNPYQPWIECMADWFLIHRSAGDVRTLCVAAGFPDSAITVDLDRSGLTLIVKCQQF